MTFFVNVNNVQVKVNPNMSILQACELAGVIVPRFCYHERLSVAGNCRMCLVEVEKMPKLQASCAVPVSPNMSIKTNTLAVKKAREGVLEFLLVNHPLDCPICDQGGECDLQDQSMVYGGDRSRFREFKRAVEDKNCGPLIKTVMTRCIHCTRCVRFANEVAGVPEFGTSGRGNLIEIGTYIEKVFASELSGNIIDLCPVGALTSKPYSFLARPWELKSTESIDVFDPIHSNIRIDSRGYEVMRVLPKLNELINDEWISDKARFAFDGLTNQRLTNPLIKKDGSFQEVSWSTAINLIADKISKIKKPNKLAFSIGPFSDLNSLLFAKQLLNRFNGVVISEEFEDSINLDFQTSYRFNTTLKSISNSDACLLIGVNCRTEAALLNYHLRKRYLNGNFSVSYIGSHLNFTFPANNLGPSLNNLLAILEGKHKICKVLRKSKKPCIIIGKSFINSIKQNNLELFLRCFKLNTTAVHKDWNGINLLNVKSSDMCRYDIGLQYSYSEKSFDVIYSLGDVKTINRKNTSNFVIYQNHHGCVDAQKADVILPSLSFMEKTSLYGNIEGKYQLTQSVTLPLGESKDDWKIVYAIYNNDLHPLKFDNVKSINPLSDIEDIIPSVQKLINNIYPSFFKSSLFHYSFFSLNNFYLSSGVFDNFYKTDIISECSLSMSKCSSQLLDKNPFK